MIKDCKSCIHTRICSHKNKNKEYKKQMRELIEEWGVDNPFGYTEDCPEWHEKYEVIHISSDMIPKKNEDKLTTIEFVNGSEIKTIPCEDNIRGKRAELPIHYFDFERCENTEDIFKEVMKTLFD